MFDIRHETLLDIPAREHLLDRCFGPGRFAKTSERLREGRRPAEGLALAAVRGGALAGTIRLWDVSAGEARPALLLGPVAVDPALHGGGLGTALIRAALEQASALGHRAVILVGDEPYYRRFGFTHDTVSGLSLPGPVELGRFLGRQLVPGALAGATGIVTPTGRRAAEPEPLRLRAA